MKTLISAKLAGSVLLAALGALAVFHVLVLAEVLPSEIVWGGRIEDPSDNLVMLETAALIVTLVFALIVAAKVGYVKMPRLGKVVRIGICARHRARVEHCAADRVGSRWKGDV